MGTKTIAYLSGNGIAVLVSDWNRLVVTVATHLKNIPLDWTSHTAALKIRMEPPESGDDWRRWANKRRSRTNAFTIEQQALASKTKMHRILPIHGYDLIACNSSRGRSGGARTWAMDFSLLQSTPKSSEKQRVVRPRFSQSSLGLGVPEGVPPHQVATDSQFKITVPRRYTWYCDRNR
jgi:hypothetical protein